MERDTGFEFFIYFLVLWAPQAECHLVPYIGERTDISTTNISKTMKLTPNNLQSMESNYLWFWDELLSWDETKVVYFFYCCLHSHSLIHCFLHTLGIYNYTLSVSPCHCFYFSAMYNDIYYLVSDHWSYTTSHSAVWDTNNGKRPMVWTIYIM